MRRVFWLGVVALLMAPIQAARSEVPQSICVQGYLDHPVTQLPVTGAVNFGVVVYDAEIDGTRIWPPGSPTDPPFSIPGVPVTNGLFSLELGDSTLTPLVFGHTGDGREARWIEFSTAPQSAGPYAAMSPRVALRTAPYAFRVGFVDNKELTDHVELGSVTLGNSGSAKLFNNLGSEVVTLNSMGGAAGNSGLAQLRDGQTGESGVILSGDSGNVGGSVTVQNGLAGISPNSTAVALLGNGTALAGGPGGVILVRNGESESKDTIYLRGNGSGGGARVSLHNGQSSNQETITLRSNDGGAGSGIINVNSSTGPRVTIQGLQSGGEIELLNSNNIGSAFLNTLAGNGGGRVSLWSGQLTNQETFRADGNADGGGAMSIANGQTGGSVETIRAIGNGPSNGGEIQICNNGGTPLIRLIGDDPAVPSNDDAHVCVQGKVSARDFFTGECNVDLAETFELTDREQIEPGMVLVMDAKRPGHLTLSTRSYDKKVAGIVSGAGGLNPGVKLGQRADGSDDLPIALSGRVYCFVDATTHAVEIGDLLTTSDTPGYAMKATDRDHSFGAVLGKALGRLEKGKTGMVLVLVALQ